METHTASSKAIEQKIYKVFEDPMDSKVPLPKRMNGFATKTASITSFT